jgi:hypothetical protein
MAFPQRLLTDGEEVIVELRPHWAFLGWPLVTVVAAMALALAVVAAFPHAPTAVGAVLLVAVGLAALWLAGRVIRRRTRSLVLTNFRIVERSGLLSRTAVEIRLDRVTELRSRQSLVGFLLRSGEILVEAGRESGVVVFDHVARPAVVQRLISEQLSAVRRAQIAQPGQVSASSWGSLSLDTPPHGMPGPTRGSPEPSIADRLVQLEELRRRGILTDDEFRAKKADLLDRL